MHGGRFVHGMMSAQVRRGESISPPGMSPSIASVWTYSNSCSALWGQPYSTIRYFATLCSLWACARVRQRAAGDPPCSGRGSWDAGLWVLCPGSSLPLRACSLLLTVHLTDLQPSEQLCPERPAKGLAVPTWVNFKEKAALWIHTGRQESSNPAVPMAHPGFGSWPEITTLLIFLWHSQMEETGRAAKQ